MPEYRTHTLVADRSDVDFHKRPDLLRKSRRKWILLAGLLGFWPLLWQAAGRNDQTIYWAHTVSNSHQMFQNDCKKCHREWCQTFRMNFMTPSEIRVVEANTCQTCHWEDTRDHNPDMVPGQAQGCFDCHAEHRHHADLNLVADVYCVVCHRELEIRQNRTTIPSPSFVTNIDSFENHPEFHIRRRLTVETLANLQRQPHHRGIDLASPPPPAESATGTSWAWTDKANFKFNHQRHLLEAGVGIPADHSDAKSQQPDDKNPPTKKLNCADCHEADAEGEYFKPINYERHCAACHQLNFSEELSLIGLPDTSPVPLPHESPEIIRGTLRDRLTSYISNHPEKLAAEKAAVNPLFPKAPEKNNENPERNQPTAQEKAEWVERHMQEVEDMVTGRHAGAKLRGILKGCEKCHEVDPKDNPQGVAWEIRPTNIPERWLPHSRFRHDRHDMLECYECHYKEPPVQTGSQAFRSDPGSIFQSKTAKDVLMPSIDNCRDCHGSPVGTPIPGRVKARADCIECHTYHHTLEITKDTRDRWDRRDGKGDVQDRLWNKREVPISRDRLFENLPKD